MPLKYSVGARKNPMDQDAAPRFYATAQVAQIIDVRDLCKSCRAHSTFTMGDSMGVIETILEHAIEELKKGNMVRLGGLGNFRTTINDQTGTDSEKGFDESCIKSCHVLFTPGDDLTDMCNNMTYERTLSRKEVQDIKKAKKAAQSNPAE